MALLVAAGLLSRRPTLRRARGLSGATTGADQPVAAPSSPAVFLDLHHEGQGPRFPLCCPRLGSPWVLLCCEGQGGCPWLQEVPGPCARLAAAATCSRQQSLCFLSDQFGWAAQGHGGHPLRGDPGATSCWGIAAGPRTVSRMGRLRATHATAPGAPMGPSWHWQMTKMTCRVTVNREGT